VEEVPDSNVRVLPLRPPKTDARKTHLSEDFCLSYAMITFAEMSTHVPLTEAERTFVREAQIDAVDPTPMERVINWLEFH
jgi:hypothetical protein